MKKIFLILLTFLSSMLLFSQKNKEQEIFKPKEGKSLVYIIRSNSVGFLLNFRLYDKEKFLGTLSSSDYLVYECDPGEHLFWVASENRNFIEANLEVNKVYVLDAKGAMGAFIAQVDFSPLNPTDKKHKKWFYQAVKNNEKVLVIPKIDKEKEENVRLALERYYKLKEKESKQIKILNSDMNFENANKL